MRHPFLKSLAGTRTDPYFKNVSLLLHGDGTNGGNNNTFIDDSVNNTALTTVGVPAQGTFSPYGNNWSTFFDGTGDYLVSAANAGLNFGTGDFTIEFWFCRQNPKVQSFHDNIVGNRVTTFPGGVWHIFCGPAVGDPFYFQLSVAGTGWSISGGTCNNGVWNHIAVVRSGNTFTLYVNGSSVASGTQTAAVGDSTNGISVGAFRDGAYPSIGYVSNLRIVKGTAVYTGNFTPPTNQLTAITNTSLLICHSKNFLDGSTNNLTITRNGEARITNFGPFPEEYSEAIHGGGVNLRGDSAIQASNAPGAANFASGVAFTFQCWFYRRNFGLQVLIQGGPNSFQVTATASGGGLTYGKAGVSDLFYGVGSCPTLAWTHITICRNTNNQTRMWVNGVSVASSNSDTYAFTTTLLMVGSNYPPSTIASGYFSDVRFLNGEALYDPTSSANISIPTQPLTAITNTSFLLNFKNAAIIDHARKANLRTQGAAQISTSVKKDFGTGSLQFNGSTAFLEDFLSQLSYISYNYRFGTGDFTVEYWVYPISNTSGCIIDLRNGEVAGEGTAYYDFFTSTGKLGLYFGANTYTSTSTVPTNQWTHIAVSRAGTSLRVFFNGVQDGATVTHSANLAGSMLRIGVNTAGAGYLNGYLDDVRITKGVARYTSNFTPPNEAHPNK